MELYENNANQLQEGWFTYNRLSSQIRTGSAWEYINEKPEQGVFSFDSFSKNLFIKNKTEFFTQLKECSKHKPIINFILKTNAHSFLINAKQSQETPELVVGIITNADIIVNKIESLKIEKEKAEHSDYLKSAFLANMAHDIRVPLNSISGFSEMLTEDDFTKDEKRGFAEIIERNTENLVNIINDLIDVSKIEADQIELVNSIFEPEKLFLDLFNRYHGELERLKKHDVKLKLSIPKSKKRAYVYNDKLRLRQILDQLINNAVKFTHTGTITIGYKFSNQKNIELFVEDSGIGIPEDKVSQVFNMFKKDGNNYSKPFGSNGLGLHIAKHLTSIIGSELCMSSRVGKGTDFCLKLPVYAKIETTKQTGKQLKQRTLSSNWTGKKILVVDDTKEVYDYIRLTLRNSELTCLYANSGKAALKIFNSISDIDLILMDIQMPEMNGIATLKRLKKKEIKIPVIALTAFALTGDKEQFLSEGFNEYLSKPINQQELFRTLKTHL